MDWSLENKHKDTLKTNEEHGKVLKSGARSLAIPVELPSHIYTADGLQL